MVFQPGVEGDIEWKLTNERFELHLEATAVWGPLGFSGIKYEFTEYLLNVRSCAVCWEFNND